MIPLPRLGCGARCVAMRSAVTPPATTWNVRRCACTGRYEALDAWSRRTLASSQCIAAVTAASPQCMGAFGSRSGSRSAASMPPGECHQLPMCWGCIREREGSPRPTIAGFTPSRIPAVATSPGGPGCQPWRAANAQQGAIRPWGGPRMQPRPSGGTQVHSEAVGGTRVGSAVSHELFPHGGDGAGETSCA